MAEATTEVDIWNLSLAHVRAKAQVSDPAEATKEANACRLFYTHTRRLTLSANDWAFARQIETLSVNAAAVTHYLREYAYGYNLPNGMITPRYLYPFRSKVPFEICLAPGVDNSRMLLTNITKPKMVFTDNVTAVTIMDEQFISALSWHLAAYIGPKLTGNEKWYDIAMKMYRDILPSAISHVNQNYEKDQLADPPDAPWITAR